MRGKHACSRAVLPSPAFALACCLAAFLLCAGLCVGSSAAKYVERSSADDSACVAGIVVNATGDGNGGSHAIVLGDDSASSAMYSFTVSNNDGDKVSEVAYEYDIVVKATSGSANGVSVSLAGEDLPKTFSENKVAFEGVGILPAGDMQSNSHNLTFSVDDGSSTSNSTSVAFEISVYAEQID